MIASWVEQIVVFHVKLKRIHSLLTYGYSRPDFLCERAILYNICKNPQKNAKNEKRNHQH